MNNYRPLLFTALAVLTVASFFSLGTEDIQVWISWGQNVDQHGLVAGYRLNEHEHPPLLSLLFYLSWQLAHFTGLHPVYALKSGFLLFLITSIWIIHSWNGKNVLFNAYIYLTLMYSCLSLSYFDIYFAPPFLLGCYFLHQQRHFAAVFCLALATMLKYPPLIVAPFFLVYLVANPFPGQPLETRRWHFVREAILPALLVLVPVTLLFGLEPWRALQRAFHHTELSDNALNFNWITTRVIHVFLSGRDLLSGWRDNMQIQHLVPGWAYWSGTVLFCGFYFSTLAVFVRRKHNTVQDLLLFAMVGHMAYFIFNIGVHENHLFLGCLLAIALACINPAYRALACIMVTISSINLFIFYGFNGARPGLWPDWWLQQCLASSTPLPHCSALPTHPPLTDFPLMVAIFNTGYFMYLWFTVCFNRLELRHDQQ